MTQGYQADEVAEYAALVEIAAATRAVTTAEEHRNQLIRDALGRGARSHVIAEHLGISRATLYRLIRT